MRLAFLGTPLQCRFFPSPVPRPFLGRSSAQQGSSSSDLAPPLGSSVAHCTAAARVFPRRFPWGAAQHPGRPAPAQGRAPGIACAQLQGACGGWLAACVSRAAGRRAAQAHAWAAPAALPPPCSINPRVRLAAVRAALQQEGTLFGSLLLRSRVFCIDELLSAACCGAARARLALACSCLLCTHSHSHLHFACATLPIAAWQLGTQGTLDSLGRQQSGRGQPQHITRYSAQRWAPLPPKR